MEAVAAVVIVTFIVVVLHRVLKKKRSETQGPRPSRLPKDREKSV